MSSAYLVMGYRCNHRCLCCPIEGERARASGGWRDLTLGELKEAIDSTAGTVDYVELSGGEPTIQNHFLDVLDYTCNVKRTPVVILTNGSMLASPKFVARMLAVARPELLRVVVALYASEPCLHDEITRRRGSFERSLRGIDHCLRSGVRVAVKNVLQRRNVSDLPNYVRFVYRAFPDSVPLTLHGLDVMGAALEHSSETAVRFSEIAPSLEAALDIVTDMCASGRRRAVRVFSVPYCSLDPYYWSWLDARSKLPQAAYRAPEEERERRALQLGMASDSGTHFQPCRTCAAEPCCPGVWRAYTDLYGTDDLRPFVAEGVDDVETEGVLEETE